MIENGTMPIARNIRMKNKSRIIVCGVFLGALPCFGTLTNAAQMQFNLTPASMWTNGWGFEHLNSN